GPGYICPTPKKVATSQEPCDFEFFAEAVCIYPRIRYWRSTVMEDSPPYRVQLTSSHSTRNT
ncbi:MAG TPA: hypothetical protein VFR08_01965, partial [Candidatus Angelobacter sp.]|nr:hypothetical protein [Candidatus Angelobacter sp.]